ncbi:MAG: hypothetical protein R3Y32_08445 [Bacillota bacterium]
MKRETKSLISYTFSHFAVDFACFFILISCVLKSTSVSEYAILALIYNVIAFGGQVFVGSFCDCNKNFKAGLVGGLLVLVSLAFFSLPICALILCSVGNAFFHVGGGIDSLVYSNGKAARSGIFVSTGAVGLILGTLLGGLGVEYIYIPILIMALANISMWKFGLVKGESDPIAFELHNTKVKYEWVVLLALATIVFRSFVGGSIEISWNIGWLIILPSCSACGGKALGGILGDKFGVRKLGTISLAVSVPFIFFGSGNAFLCVVGLVLFNMSMPLTLGIVFSAMGRNTEGLSFGLTTLALLIGHIATAMLFLQGDLLKYLLAVLIVVSSVAIYISAKNKKNC